MLNVLTLAGNIGSDIENFFTPDGGTHIASFSLAFASGFKDGQEQTGWIKVKCFSKLADTTENYLHKGARIAVSGYLQQQRWETENNEKRSSYQLNANSIEFIRINDKGEEPAAGTDQPPF
ncbi:MAG: single-stranded DNA-binding protein [Thermodesulfobacteriota bacterium]|nr:single-stranded DNA-binding protein [Thermodesulfobacteriota bacterium]